MARIINAATGLQLTTPRNPFNGDERTHSSRNPNPSIRLDYILPSPILATNISASAIFRTDYLHPTPPGLESNDTQVASDHLPVWTIFDNPYREPIYLAASLHVTTDQAIVSWNALPGAKYVVRGSYNLNSWFTVSPVITATNSSCTWTGALTAGNMFFQIQTVP